MGYPDIIAPPELLKELIGDRRVEYRADSEAICKRHGLALRQIPDAHALFKVLGCELYVYDVVQERGCEILCDLNLPQQIGLDLYDVVLDVGTAEHCFNIGQALKNMAGAVKLGGYIVHENPFNCGNHGFYSLNPTLFHDFYTQNGFKVLDCRLVNRNGGECKVPHTKRFRFVEQEVNTFALAQRTEIRSFVAPVQSKYANLIPAAGGHRAKELVHGT